MINVVGDFVSNLFAVDWSSAVFENTYFGSFIPPSWRWGVWCEEKGVVLIIPLITDSSRYVYVLTPSTSEFLSVFYKDGEQGSVVNEGCGPSL